MVNMPHPNVYCIPSDFNGLNKKGITVFLKKQRNTILISNQQGYKTIITTLMSYNPTADADKFHTISG